jgi:trimeric autotransporter adhesin
MFDPIVIHGSGVGAPVAIDPALDSRTFNARLAGSGELSATVTFQGSDDDRIWNDLGSVTLSGTDSDSDSLTVTSTAAKVRASVAAPFGQVSTVSVTVEALSSAQIAAVTGDIPILTGFTGANNTGLGVAAGDSITSGSGNTALGLNAGTALTTGDANTAVGTDALTTATTGSTNTAIGSAAMASLTTGSDNVAVGRAAGNGLTTGFDNVAVGKGAGLSLTIGRRNAVVGSLAMSATNGGNEDNVAVGYNAMGGGGFEADKNVAVGQGALAAVESADNVAIGYHAMLQFSGHSAGSKNVAVGSLAGDELVGGGGNALIGYQAGKGQGDTSNKFMVGLGNGQGLIFSVDEGGALLNISVRYADGTMKAIVGLALV